MPFTSLLHRPLKGRKDYWIFSRKFTIQLNFFYQKNILNEYTCRQRTIIILKWNVLPFKSLCIRSSYVNILCGTVSLLLSTAGADASVEALKLSLLTYLS